MRGRYLKPRNPWEIAWNAALDLHDAARKDRKVAEELLPEPYKAALDASDILRRKQEIPEDEWHYEECRRYTQSELGDRKKLQEWANRFMPEEEREKRARKMKESIL